MIILTNNDFKNLRYSIQLSSDTNRERYDLGIEWNMRISTWNIITEKVYNFLENIIDLNVNLNR